MNWFKNKHTVPFPNEYFLGLSFEDSELNERHMANAKNKGLTPVPPYFEIFRTQKLFKGIARHTENGENVTVNVYDRSTKNITSIYEFDFFLDRHFEHILLTIGHDIYSSPDNSDESVTKLNNFFNDIVETYQNQLIEKTDLDQSTINLKIAAALATSETKGITDFYKQSKWFSQSVEEPSQQTEVTEVVIDDADDSPESQAPQTPSEPTRENTDRPTTPAVEVLPSRKEQHREELGSQALDNDLYDPEKIKQRLNQPDLPLLDINDELPGTCAEQSDPLYVAVADNNNKKMINRRIIKLAETLRSKGERNVIELADSLSQEFTVSVENFKKKHTIPDSIYNELKTSLNNTKESAINDMKNAHAAERDKKNQQAKAIYEAAIKQNNLDYEHLVSKDTTKLNKNYDSRFSAGKQKIYQEALEKQSSELDSFALEQFHANQLAINDCIANVLTVNADKLRTLSESGEKAVEKDHAKFITENIQASKLKAEQVKIQNENKRAEHEETQQAATAAATKELVKAVSDTPNKVAKVVSDNLAQLYKNNQADVSSQKQSETVSNQDFLKQLAAIMAIVNNSNTNESTTLQSPEKSDAVQVEKLIKKLDKKNNRKIEELESNFHSSFQSYKKKKQRQIITGSSILLLLTSGAIGGSIYHSNRVQAAANSRSEAASKKVKQSKISQSSTTTIRTPKVTLTTYLSDKQYKKAAASYPNRLNEIENYIFEDGDAASLKDFNAIYSSKFGQLDLTILQKKSNTAIVSEFWHVNTTDLDTAKRTQSVGLALIATDHTSLANEINQQHNSAQLSSAIKDAMKKK